MEPTLKIAQIPRTGYTSWNPSFEFGFVIVVDGMASCWGPKHSRKNPAIESMGTKGEGSTPWGFTYKE